MQLFKDVKSPADAMKVIKENPAFVENLEGVVVDSVEDLIKVRNASVAPLYSKNDHFTKTGSGQT
jgi:hypothetical protein